MFSVSKSKNKCFALDCANVQRKAKFTSLLHVNCTFLGSYVNAVDQQKLDESLHLKYQNLMGELQVLRTADEASLEVIEKAAQ